MKPASEEIYSRIPGGQKPDIQPEVIGGLWFPTLFHQSVDRERRVILHFRGGGYVIGATRRSDVGFGARILINSTSTMVFFPQCRLASAHRGEFPAALQDALTAYAYLLNLGILPSRIVISGDSAGAHLAITLLRYLSALKPSLPAPSAVLLWSPWLDLATDPDWMDRHANSKIDFVPSNLVRWALRVFPPTGMELSHPYLSPLRHPFVTKTPVWVQIGGKEVLYDEAMAFVRKMSGVQNNMVEIHEVPAAPHDIILAGNLLGFEKEASNAADKAHQWLDSNTRVE